MDNKLVESYLDFIAGKVIDEDKIVTYKSLSSSLNIHVNTAKQLLHTYLKNEKSNKTYPISATYLVAGKVIDGSISISIVNESDLKSTHSKLIQVTSEHVYSVQKGKKIIDVKCLCGVDKDSTSKSSNLVIKHHKNVLKQKQVKQKPKSDESENKKIIKQALVSSKTVDESVKKTETVTSETHDKKTSPKGNSEKEKAQQCVKKPMGNIADMFAKANKKNMEKSAKADCIKDKPDVNVEDEKIIEKETSKRRSESKDSLKRKQKTNKRRRIQMASDSEESDADDEEHIEIDPEPEHSPPAITNLEEEREETKEFISKNKRKKRKVIDKTVMNEDGYLETKKEVVFETDSENETEELKKPKEEKKLKVEKTKGGDGPKKQSSLLSFFKKG